jgi:four helix bundle protein
MTDGEDGTFSHEKLDVYHTFLSFAEVSESIVTDAGTFAVADQLERATESIGANLIRGNSQWTQALRAAAFDVSMASALECAACIDVCRAKELMAEKRARDAKRQLHDIAGMLFGLRKKSAGSAREDDAIYGEVVFAHERLDVYRLSLDFVKWADTLAKESRASTQESKKLDTGSTSLVLNIAEGNGRFSHADRTKFIDTAHSAALQCVLVLDLMVARHRIPAQRAVGSKAMLRRICAMLLGWRRKLTGASSSIPAVESSS